MMAHYAQQCRHVPEDVCAHTHTQGKTHQRQVTDAREEDTRQRARRGEVKERARDERREWGGEGGRERDRGERYIMVISADEW